MPLIQDSAPLLYPQTNLVLKKYLDLPKFLSILSRQSLFFTRLDKLEDQFEGETAVASRKILFDWYYEDGIISQDEANKRVDDYLQHGKKMKALMCINCWNKNKKEDAALWKIYSEFGKGIMIRSSIRSLIKSLEDSKEIVRVSEVRYIDHETDLAATGNTYFPIIHKNVAYKYEEEVRLIFEVVPEFGWDYDWTKEEVEVGKYISIDPQHLIEEVVLAIFSQLGISTHRRPYEKI